MWRAVVLLSLLGLPAHAAKIALSPASVISSSVSYPTYGAANVLDQQAGPTAEAFGQHYWLAADNTRSPVFFVIDLGAALRLSSAGLYNTHNGNYQDRGTGRFTLYGGNTRPAAGAMLVGAATLVSGVLAAEPAAAPALTEQVFAVAALTAFRYVEFVPTGTATVAAPASATAFGLNEILLFSAPAAAMPEPGAAGLLAIALVLISLGIALPRHRTVRPAR